MTRKQRQYHKQQVKNFHASKKKWNLDNPDEAELKRIQHRKNAGEKEKKRLRKMLKKQLKEGVRTLKRDYKKGILDITKETYEFQLKELKARVARIET